tara:strand:+ start:1309 stop:1785 length:477 start_codon:yes stop_codon:yes gene_type:complete
MKTPFIFTGTGIIVIIIIAIIKIAPDMIKANKAPRLIKGLDDIQTSEETINFNAEDFNALTKYEDPIPKYAMMERNTQYYWIKYHEELYAKEIVKALSFVTKNKIKLPKVLDENVRYNYDLLEKLQNKSISLEESIKKDGLDPKEVFEQEKIKNEKKT